MNFPLRTFVVGVKPSGQRILHLSGCQHSRRYKRPVRYWWTDAHGLSLYCYLENIWLCGSCLPRKEIEAEYIPYEHMQRLEPLLRQRRIEAVLA